MPPLGQMLAADKVITPGQLEEAIQAQVIFGGRLGTNLLELDFIDELTLTKYLAKKHGLPTLDWTQLLRLKPEVLKLFTKKLAKKCEAFPLKLEGRDLYVVMADPSSIEALDAIKFATGKNIKPLVLPEVRIYDFLHRFYGIGRELRYISLADKYQPARREEKKAAPASPLPPGMNEREWKEREKYRTRIDFSGASELQSEEDFKRLAEFQFRAEKDSAEAEAGVPGEMGAFPPPTGAGGFYPPSLPPGPAAPVSSGSPSPRSYPLPGAPSSPLPGGVPYPAGPGAPVYPSLSPPPPGSAFAPPFPSLAPGAEPLGPPPPPAPPAPPPAVLSPNLSPPVSVEVIPPPAKTPPPSSPSSQPYREVAQALYSLFMKEGITRYLAKESLQEFLKLFVKTQLQYFILNLNYLANWLIIEAKVPVEWLEEVLTRFKTDYAPRLGVTVLMPGEALPASPRPREAEAVEIQEPLPEAGIEELPESALVPLVPVDEIEHVVTLPEREEPWEGLAGPPESSSGSLAEAETVAGRPAEAVAAPPETAGESSSPEVLRLTAEDLATPEEAAAFKPEVESEEEAEEEYQTLTLAEARQKLMEEVEDRNDISRIVLGFARANFKRSILFTVRGQTLYGWDGRGEGINAELVSSLMLPLTEPSVFQLVHTTKSFFLGPLPPTPVNSRWLKMVGGQKPNNVFIMPVVVNEKVVYMFYGDNGEGEFVPGNAPELQILAYQIPAALSSLLRRKKEKMLGQS